MIQKLIKNTLIPTLTLIGLAGCQVYHHAEISGNVIHDPQLGWNGYTVNIPDGYYIIPKKVAAASAGPLEHPVNWLVKERDIYTLSLALNFDERFLFKSDDEQSYILFASERLDFIKSLNQFSTVIKKRVMYNIRDYQKVRLNDSDALFEQMTINGMMACRVSGRLRPYFKKNYPTIFYEGYFFLGHLNETFWVEGISSAKGRTELQRGVKEMAESLMNPL